MKNKNIKLIKSGHSFILTVTQKQIESFHNPFELDLEENVFLDFDTGKCTSLKKHLTEMESHGYFLYFPYVLGFFHTLPSVGKTLWVNYYDLFDENMINEEEVKIMESIECEMMGSSDEWQ